MIYRRFVDNTFLLFRSKEHFENFRFYLNCQQSKIKFTSEVEEKNCICFLDINRENNIFLTSLYSKPTFSGVFTNSDIYIPFSYKSGLISSLLSRAFKLCSNFEIFHQEIIFLKYIFKMNGCTSNFIDKRVDKIFIEKKVFSVAQKKELVCDLPFIGKKSLHLRSQLVKFIQQNLKFCSLNVIF